MRNKFRAQWSRDDIDSAKQEIRAEIDADGRAEDSEARLQYILESLNTLEDDISSAALLRRYILSMSALVHHERNGGLTASQVRHAAQVAEQVLMTGGLDPERSLLRYLYAEIYSIRSQIARKDGDHWYAAWEQASGVRMASSTASDAAAGRSAMGAGLRYLRLGDADIARVYLQEALSKLPAAEQPRCYFHLINATRLQGEQQQALHWVAEAHRTNEAGEHVKHLEWLKALIEAQGSGELRDLRRMVDPRATHHEASYFIDVTLLAMASRQRDTYQRLAKLESKTRSGSIGVHRQGTIYRCAKALESLLDSDIPLQLRLNALGDMLAKRQTLLFIEHEMYVLAAAARGLATYHMDRHASIVLAEYEALSLRLSRQQHRDVLNLVGDLLDRSWYRPGAQGMAIETLESNREDKAAS